MLLLSRLASRALARPNPRVWADIQARDVACVSCGLRPLPPTFQHRVRVGMGGSKVVPSYTDGVLSCLACNQAYESSLQAAAIRYGWKIPASFPLVDPAAVPVFYAREGGWFILTRGGNRLPISSDRALTMMRDVYGDQYV